MLKRIRIVNQLSQVECGLCCCAMLLRYYKSYENLGDVQAELGVGRDGLSLRRMYGYLKGKGMSVRLFRSDALANDLVIEKPVIAFLEKSHFVVIEKCKNGYVYLCDPAMGREKKTIEEFNRSFGGFLIHAEPGKEFKKKHRSLGIAWKAIIDTFKNNMSALLSVLALMVLSYGFVIGIPILIQNIIDSVTSNLSNPLSYSTLLIACCIGYFVIVYFRNRQIIILNVILGRTLEAGTYEKLLKAAFKYFEIRSPGDLLYRLVATSSVKEILTTQISSGVISIGAVVFIFIYMLMSNARLAALSCAIFLLTALLLVVISPILSRSTKREILERTKAQSLQSEALYSISSIKMTGREGDSFQDWAESYEDVIARYCEKMKITNIYSSATDMIGMFAPVAVLIFGFNMYLNRAMTLGEVIAFQSISSIFFGQVIGIYSSFSQWVSVISFVERIGDIWASEEDDYNEEGLAVSLAGDISIKGLSFGYGESSPTVLRDINLEIKRHSKVAIVGNTGSGKSTLGKLICSLYQPQEGEISYDGIPGSKLNKRILRQQFGVIPQEAVLLNKSVFDNITLGNPEITMDTVIDACERVCIHDEIMKMPMKYETIVSELGANFSGGQRQRILLARLLISKPAIILLDEASSSLDSIKEKRIAAEFSGLGCTQIVIAHRLSTIIDADCIVVMNDGSIAESGKHDELMKMRGKYSELYLASAGMLE